MVVIINQGKAKMIAQPGILAGQSEAQNMEIMNNQRKRLKEQKDETTLMLLDDETNDIMDELIQDDLL